MTGLAGLVGTGGTTVGSGAFSMMSTGFEQVGFACFGERTPSCSFFRDADSANGHSYVSEGSDSYHF